MKGRGRFCSFNPGGGKRNCAVLSQEGKNSEPKKLAREGGGGSELPRSWKERGRTNYLVRKNGSKKRTFVGKRYEKDQYFFKRRGERGINSTNLL